MAATPSTIRVAVTQAEPEWLDLDKAVKKTCALIEEAASNGAKLVSFPECWITGYPAWIWSRVLDFNLAPTYIKNSLRIDSPEMDAIRATAARHSIAVVLGFSERDQGNSIYIAQAIIDPAGSTTATITSADGQSETKTTPGRVSMTRRKIKPTHMERTVFGDAAGGADTLRNVAEVGIGSVDGKAGVRVGALACWEHAQPLLKYHTCMQREHIHVAAWPPVVEHDGGPGLWSMSKEGCRNLSRTYAIESQSFVLHTGAVIGQKGLDRMDTAMGAIMNRPGGGSSAIYGPDGRQLTEDIPETEEGILYADLNMDLILASKSFLDLGGHYSRPDILWLGVDEKAKKHVVVRENAAA